MQAAERVGEEVSAMSPQMCSLSDKGGRRRRRPRKAGTCVTVPTSPDALRCHSPGALTVVGQLQRDRKMTESDSDGGESKGGSQRGKAEQKEGVGEPPPPIPSPQPPAPQPLLAEPPVETHGPFRGTTGICPVCCRVQAALICWLVLDAHPCPDHLLTKDCEVKHLEDDREVEHLKDEYLDTDT